MNGLVSTILENLEWWFYNGSFGSNDRKMPNNPQKGVLSEGCRKQAYTEKETPLETNNIG